MISLVMTYCLSLHLGFVIPKVELLRNQVDIILLLVFNKLIHLNFLGNLNEDLLGTCKGYFLGNLLLPSGHG